MPPLLERIILAYLEGEGVRLKAETFFSSRHFQENPGEWGAYCHPPYDTIVMRPPEAYEDGWYPCPSPLKLGHYFVPDRGDFDGSETTFRRGHSEAVA